MRLSAYIAAMVCTGAILAATARTASAQSFGIELHNTLMPASSGMGGVSIARPQDPISAINANPASLTQMGGTQFIFGGGIANAYTDIDQTAAFPAIDPFVTPYSASSDYPATVLGNIGVTQDLSALGIPATFGAGFVTNAGAGIDFAHVPASNGTSATMSVFELVSGVGMDLSHNLSVGASFQFGTGFLDSPFVGLGRNTLDYGVRGTFGVDYDLGTDTTIGAYYQTKQNFTFEDAILLQLGPGSFSAPLNVNMDLPRNVGLGFANSSLMCGNLLLGVDVLYKNWSDTDFFGSIYNDQWVVQVGSQYTAGRYKFRLGYVWAENPIQSPPDVNIGGVTPPGLLAAAQYVQSQVAVINQHRISAGVGLTNLLPGIDVDLSAGGMLPASQSLGATHIDISSYWLSFGLTWHFDGAASGAHCVP